MTNEIENIIKISTIRDVQIKLKKAELGGAIIPELVYELIEEVEADFIKLTKEDE